MSLTEQTSHGGSTHGWVTRGIIVNAPSPRDRDFIEALIEKTPGVAGGSACVARTRIAVWALENYRRLGWTEDELLRSYPTLRPADLYAAWRYAALNGAEIDREIEENEVA